ncbi:MAG TPA: serine/threonine-protein kinase [Kofleriaceae bacterium]|nr:serine/threonine-protein kinase [Kofleriaceae bacterium]
MPGGDLVGQRVGHYQVEQTLGEGGMARVYVATDTNVGRRVALKALLPELGSKPAVAERFMNEARAMGKIHHPGVIDVFDVLVGPSGELCIVMELINGRNLREYLDAYGPLPLPQAVPVMRMLADALAAAHALGIVHRDLKPENVLLVADPLGGLRPKVLDFGIAKVADANNVQTATNAQMGTATYMAPEQFRSAKMVDHRADIYALGCLYFEILVGRPPFGGRNLFEQMSAHLTQRPPLELLPQGTPPAVTALIDRMLVKDRDQRLASLVDAVAILDGRAPPPAIYVPPPAPAVGRPGPGPSRANAPPTAVVNTQAGSRSWLIALIAIIVVAAGVAVALALT